MVINFILSKLYFSVSFYYNFRGVYTKIVIIAICEFALFVTIRQIMNAKKKFSVLYYYLLHLYTYVKLLYMYIEQ